MTESAHSLKNTIVLLCQGLDLDSARLIAKMTRRRGSSGQLPMLHSPCHHVFPVDERGAKRLGIATPAFGIVLAKGVRQAASGTTLILHVNSYRNAVGEVVRYADIANAGALLERIGPLTSVMHVSGGMILRYGHRDDGFADAGHHPAEYV